MTDPILSVDELAAIREVGESGMITPIQIWRQSVDSRYDPDPSYDYSDAEDEFYDFGDDELTYTYDDSGDPGVLIASIDGWFVSSPLAGDVTDGSGQLVTLNTVILRVAVGTDLRPHDLVRKVEAPQNEYVTIDVNDDDTWPEWTRATLRRRE